MIDLDDLAPSVVSTEEVNAFLAEHMPSAPVAEVLKANFARCRWDYHEGGTRPGGYISGPTIMNAIDCAVWLAVFTRAGITPMAVTWELKVNFLRPALGGDLIADATLHKFGPLSYASVDVYVDGTPSRLVAHGTATYSVPMDR